jgi:hypothetical protein
MSPIAGPFVSGGSMGSKWPILGDQVGISISSQGEKSPILKSGSSQLATDVTVFWWDRWHLISVDNAFVPRGCERKATTMAITKLEAKAAI